MPETVAVPCRYCGAPEDAYPHHVTNQLGHTFAPLEDTSALPDALEAMGAGPGARAEAIPESSLIPAADPVSHAELRDAIHGAHALADRLEQLVTLHEGMKDATAEDAAAVAKQRAQLGTSIVAANVMLERLGRALELLGRLPGIAAAIGESPERQPDPNDAPPPVPAPAADDQTAANSETAG